MLSKNPIGSFTLRATPKIRNNTIVVKIDVSNRLLTFLTFITHIIPIINKGVEIR
jgi:hypothetical protein